MSESMNTVIALNGGRAEGLTEDTKLRVATAVELAHSLHSTNSLGRLIMAGHEAADMRDFGEDYLLKHYSEKDLPIEYENSSHDTIGNAHFTKTRRNLEPTTDPNIHVVTINWHIPRSTWTFKQVLGKHFNVSGASSPNTRNVRETTQAVASEFGAFALSLYILHSVEPDDDELREARLQKIHPRYSLV